MKPLNFFCEVVVELNRRHIAVMEKEIGSKARQGETNPKQFNGCWARLYADANCFSYEMHAEGKSLISHLVLDTVSKRHSLSGVLNRDLLGQIIPFTIASLIESILEQYAISKEVNERFQEEIYKRRKGK